MMQDSELEVFGMEGDWETEKQTVYDQWQDIDLVSDLMIPPDPIQTSLMRHSMSVPISHVPFSFHLISDVLNESQVHSLPQTLDQLPDFREHLDSSWTVPALQYSSYGSSAEAETYLNGIDSELPVYGAISPGPELGLSSLLHPLSAQRSLPSESIMSRAESNASFHSTHDDKFEPSVERFHVNSDPPGNQALARVHHQSSRRSKHSSPGPGVGKKSSRGRKGPLRSDDRLTTSEMRKVGACQTCRDRKTKVHKIGLPFGQSTC